MKQERPNDKKTGHSCVSLGTVTPPWWWCSRSHNNSPFNKTLPPQQRCYQCKNCLLLLVVVVVCFVFFSLYWDCEFCLWLVRDSTTNVPLPHCLRDCYNQLSGWPPEQGQRVISCKNRPNQFQMSFKFHFVSLNFLTTGAYLPLSKKMSRARLNFFKCSSVRLLETTWKHRQQQMCLLRQGGNNKVCFLQQKQHCQEACGCYARPDLVD